MIKYSVTKEFHFDAAHSLGNGYEGKCKNLHGHTYILQVTVSLHQGAAHDKYGFVINFDDIKKVWKEIEPSYDHQFLNETLGIQTTAENMSNLLFSAFATNINNEVKYVSKVRLYETPTSYAEVCYEP